MNQTDKNSGSKRSKFNSLVTVDMNDGTKQDIDLTTISSSDRLPLHGTVNGKNVRSATVFRPKGSKHLILSTTRNPNRGIALSLEETIAISQNAKTLAKRFGGQGWGDQTS